MAALQRLEESDILFSNLNVHQAFKFGLETNRKGRESLGGNLSREIISALTSESLDRKKNFETIFENIETFFIR